MKALAVALPLLLLTVAFSGCMEEGGSIFSGKSKKLGRDALDAIPLLDLKAGAPLWKDPQNTPHPAFNFPTLSSPAVGDKVPSFWKPIPAATLPTTIKGIELLAPAPEGTESGAGIAIFGSLAIVPGFGKNTTIVDISDPAAPKVLSSFMPQEGLATHRGATIIPYPNGRLVTVISTGRGLDVWEITDPTMPVPLTPIMIRSHKVGVIPGTPIIYNAASNGGAAQQPSAADPAGAPDDAQSMIDAQTGDGRATTGIYNLANPDDASTWFVKNWTNGYGCHHVYFWNDVEHSKFRGICAGIQYTQLWDTTDPLDPKVIVSVPVHHGIAGSPSASYGTVAFSHYAGLSIDGSILLVGDEQGGGSGPPGCTVSVDTPQGAVTAPVGALWFYDVSNEKDPKLLGWYSASKLGATGGSCTAHHGRLVPVQGRDMIAMSFYGDGVILIDFTDIKLGTLPHKVGQFADGSDTWETWYNQGYLFTGDLARGMDVIKFV